MAFRLITCRAPRTRGHEGQQGVSRVQGWPKGAMRGGRVLPGVVILQDFPQFPSQPAVITQDFAQLPYQPAVITTDFAHVPYQPAVITEDFAHFLFQPAVIPEGFAPFPYQPALKPHKKLHTLRKEGEWCKNGLRA